MANKKIKQKKILNVKKIIGITIVVLLVILGIYLHIKFGPLQGPSG